MREVGWERGKEGSWREGELEGRGGEGRGAEGDGSWKGEELDEQANGVEWRRSVKEL